MCGELKDLSRRVGLAQAAGLSWKSQLEGKQVLVQMNCGPARRVLTGGLADNFANFFMKSILVDQRIKYRG